jgi:phosphohistidine phosphatase SixA
VADVLTFLGGIPAQGVYAVVGHEPWVSGLTAILCHGSVSEGVKFKKGTAALIRLGPDGPLPGTGRLEWLIEPKVARRLGR